MLKNDIMKNLVCILFILIPVYSCEKSVPDDNMPSLADRLFRHKILDNYFVTSIAFDQEGTAWIGTYKQRLIKYNPKEFKVFNSTNSIIPSYFTIYDIAVDSRGTSGSGVMD